ncbi:PH domain-containing protein [Caldibacillus lycopersici]|uniref:PH domain-containing protein n=1 Tax=Perspicuibacillus lycopersici TaxID=1325689 RepID=A0AAE3ITK1_9BACI|nr:PH domain-containing protein [Perspicuibacillus lycopersici]
MQYQTTEYRFTASDLIIKDGGFSVLETTIPFRNIQHVAIMQTFFSRLFGLYSVTIHTGGNYFVIHYLSLEKANELTEVIRKVMP